MALQLTPLRIPSLTTDYSAETNAAAQLGKTLAGLPGEWRKQQEAAETRALLGDAMKTGDYNKLGQAYLARGMVQEGVALLGYGDKARERAAEQAWINRRSGGVSISGGVPASPAVSIPRVQAPKTGVHVAETEDDVQRLERATGMVTTDADLNAIVKTVYGEAAGESPAGQQAVAAVIRNRANQAGLTPEQITQQPNQFEPWNTAAGRARMDSMPQKRFGQIADTIAPVINEGVDPTGGATHFYAPKAQAALGRPAPRWDDGSGTDLGNHRFFSHGYGQGGGAPAMSGQAIIASAPGLPDPPAQVAQAPGFLGNAPPPSDRFAPAQQPAPPANVAQAPVPGTQIPGDDPVRLRQEAAYYERSNPEAARQMRARADAAESRRGVQQAQAGDPRADQLPASGSPTSTEPGFVIPGTTPQQMQGILADPRVQRAMEDYRTAPTERTRAIAKAELDLVLADAKTRVDEGGPLTREGKALANEKARRDLETGDQTSDIKEYNLYERQTRARGGTPDDFTTWQRANKAAGAAKTEGPIPPGFRVFRDPNGNIERVEPIPGSKAEQEANAIAEKKVKADRIKGEVGTTVGNALDDIDRLMSTATLPTSGPLGARLAGIPGTAAHDISQALLTVGANISFSQIQQMREASPTGGALGSLTENELKLLQNSYAALSQSQSPEQFKTNLGRVRATFERIVHGRTLTGQERKTGGPMTLERAKGLREEAAAAIASGAPRDAVMKRLKEDYGITPEGL